MSKYKNEADLLQSHAWKLQAQIEALDSEPAGNQDKIRRVRRSLDQCLDGLEELRVKFGVTPTSKQPPSESEPERKQEDKPEPQTEGKKQDDSDNSNAGPAPVHAGAERKKKSVAPF